MVSNIKSLHSVLPIFFFFLFIKTIARNMNSKKQRSGNTSLIFFNICILSFSNKKLYYKRAGQQFFNAPCKRVTSSLQKRKRQQSFFARNLLKGSHWKNIFYISFLFEMSDLESVAQCRFVDLRTIFLEYFFLLLIYYFLIGNKTFRNNFSEITGLESGAYCRFLDIKTIFLEYIFFLNLLFFNW